jgi:integrase
MLSGISAMASLRKRGATRFWFACYTDQNGRRVQRSTKQTEKRKAQEVANAFAKAARMASSKRLGEAQARRILSELYESVSGTPLPSASAKDYLTNWANLRKADCAPRTHAAYAQVVRDFLASLGPRAEVDISTLTRADVVKFRDEVLTRTTPATANKAVKYLRVALGSAWKDGLSQDNPAAKVDALKRTETVERRPFTVAEIKTLLAHADDEWRGIILFGLYSGQRLKDIAKLCWNNIDLKAGLLRFTAAKTKRRMELPLAAPIQNYLLKANTPDEPNAPLFPESYPIAMKTTGDSRLSQAFREILVAAGMAEAHPEDYRAPKAQKGRSRRRQVSEITFHSLRHTATSLLKSAGVGEAVAMDIIGHNSKAISRHYTHVSAETKRAALSKLPSVA